MAWDLAGESARRGIPALPSCHLTIDLRQCSCYHEIPRDFEDIALCDEVFDRAPWPAAVRPLRDAMAFGLLGLAPAFILISHNSSAR